MAVMTGMTGMQVWMTGLRMTRITGMTRHKGFLG